MGPRQNGMYDRIDVINIIENLLHHADMVMDAIQSEDPQYDAEEMLDVVEKQMKKERENLDINNN